MSDLKQSRIKRRKLTFLMSSNYSFDLGTQMLEINRFLLLICCFSPICFVTIFLRDAVLCPFRFSGSIRVSVDE